VRASAARALAPLSALTHQLPPPRLPSPASPLQVLQNPSCIHLCVTYANAGSAQRFLTDLAAAVHDVVHAAPGDFKDGTGAMYGMAESIPDKSMVGEIAFGFLDALYTTKETAAKGA